MDSGIMKRNPSFSPADSRVQSKPIEMVSLPPYDISVVDIEPVGNANESKLTLFLANVWLNKMILVYVVAFVVLFSLGASAAVRQSASATSTATSGSLQPTQWYIQNITSDEAIWFAPFDKTLYGNLSDVDYYLEVVR